MNKAGETIFRLRQELAEARRALNDCRSLRDALSDCNHQLSMDAISARKALAESEKERGRLREMLVAAKLHMEKHGLTGIISCIEQALTPKSGEKGKEAGR